MQQVCEFKDYKRTFVTDLRWFIWVIRWEVDVQEKYSSLVHWAWRSHDGRYPFVEVVTLRSGTKKKKTDRRLFERWSLLDTNTSAFLKMTAWN